MTPAPTWSCIVVTGARLGASPLTCITPVATVRRATTERVIESTLPDLFRANRGEQQTFLRVPPEGWLDRLSNGRQQRPSLLSTNREGAEASDEGEGREAEEGEVGLTAGHIGSSQKITLGGAYQAKATKSSNSLSKKRISPSGMSTARSGII